MPTISLPPQCDRAAAQALLPQMIAALGAGTMTIDASACTQIGQAVLQLLISARRTGDGAVINGSAHLCDFAHSLGLSAHLFDDVAVVCPPYAGPPHAGFPHAGPPHAGPGA